MAKKKGSKRTIFKPFKEEEKNIPHVTHERNDSTTSNDHIVNETLTRGIESGNNEIQPKEIQINSEKNKYLLDSQHFPSLFVKKQEHQTILQTTQRIESGNNEIQPKEIQINSEKNKNVLDSQHFASLFVKKQEHQTILQTTQRIESGNNEIQHKEIQINSEKNKYLLDSQHFPSLFEEKQEHQTILQTTQRQGIKNWPSNTNMHREQNNEKHRKGTDLAKNVNKANLSELDKKYKINLQIDGRRQSYSQEQRSIIFKEIDEDLFNLPKEYSLAHCIAEDLKLEKGFAINFKRKFGNIGKLIDQSLRVGDVGVVINHNQHAFYLITKKYSNFKPTIPAMRECLKYLYTQMKIRNLTKLGISRIGCGFDELEWNFVKSLINNIFAGSGIQITVCVPSKIPDHKVMSLPLNVSITKNNVWEMETETTMIILLDLNQVQLPNWTEEILDKVNNKYPFKEKLLYDIKNKELNPGDITYYHVRGETIICAFLKMDSFSHIESAFNKINRLSKKYTYMAIQTGPIIDQPREIECIVLLYRSIFKNSELWLCGETDRTVPHVIYYDQYRRDKFNASSD